MVENKIRGGKGGLPKYHDLYTYFVIIILFPLAAFSTSKNTLSHTESLTISNNRTIVSPGNIFELGFFKPGTSSRWYLGIWYKKVPERTYVWVANRDKPLRTRKGTLKISDTNLALLDQFNKTVWSTNLTGGDLRSSVAAELLDNGNFVLRDSNNNDPKRYLWQSFDFPTDTLLPQMKLGWDLKTGLNRFLRSWRSQDDPSSGDFFYKLENRGLPEFFLRRTISPVYRSGPWDGIRFSGTPEMQQLNYLVLNFTENLEEVAYTFLMTNHSMHSRMIVKSYGYTEQLTWIPKSSNWNLFLASPKDDCDVYQMCGPYGYCDTTTSPLCNCIQGFAPLNLQQWMLTDGSGGCVRKTNLSCNGDKFLRLRKMKLPDTTATVVDRKIGVKDCRARCLRDCTCTAFANADIRNGGSGCVIWTGDLLDIRYYSFAGQDLYVRLASADLEEERNVNGKIIGLIAGVTVILFLSFIMFCFWKRKQKLGRAIAKPIETAYRDGNRDLLMNGVVISNGRNLSGEIDAEELELPLMEFEAIVIATDNFSYSNRLGQGGFGIVYKGMLQNGEEIAVKRLSVTSAQGTNEFKNEVKLIARLQHINLVRLLACCIAADEKILVYEYLENLSLDSYLFDKTRSSKLNWQKRFDITNGIARGVLYLHQDSRFRIIHRDLKASNILLDKDMTPKISDFGMARIFGRDETEAKTLRVVGTYGYMPPEYAMFGVFSVKSDVFSFGVLVLEIVSGKSNKAFYNSNHDNHLLGYMWRNWKEGKGLETVDPTIVDSLSSSPSAFQPQEVLRCIQIGLLCVQELAQDRPTMSMVVAMLGSETMMIPQPKPPGYCIGRSSFETDSSRSKQSDDDSWTANQFTVSIIEAR